MLSRRDFIRSGALATGTIAFNPAFLRGAFAARAKPGPSPYGAIQEADANGLRLPKGFKSRMIARNFEPVLPSTYPMHPQPDGQATYPMPDGGWILTSNSEVPFPGQGGAGAIRFDKNGNVTDAYPILTGTQTNCSGGSTPWNTWLSCEEHEEGLTWECDIFGKKPAKPLPALGTFSHEAACVDPVGKRVYQTEDEGDSGFYRFTPEAYPDLTKGLLEVAVVDTTTGIVGWRRVPDPTATPVATRKQVPGMTKFRRGEGLFFEYPFAYVTTSSDATIWAYNVITETIEALWAGDTFKDSPAVDTDQMTRSKGGEIFVCEDEGKHRISILSADGRYVAPFIQLDGPEHTGTPELGNETTGVVFDPSGTRMYFAAQRSWGFGAIYEITGPFRRDRVDVRQPTLRVEHARSRLLRRVRAEGFRIALQGDESCRISGRLTAKVPARRGRRARTVTLARGSGRIERGVRRELLLRRAKAGADALRGVANTTGELTVKATDARGNMRVVRRAIKLTGKR